MNSVDIDEKKLSELKSLLEESFSMLILTFIKDTEEQLVQLENYAQQKKYFEISKVAHSMKGSSANMGAKHLYYLAVDLENACKIEEDHAVQETVILIRHHYPTLRSILEKTIS